MNLLLCKYVDGNEYCPFSECSTKHISTAVPQIARNLDITQEFITLLELNGGFSKAQREIICLVLAKALGYKDV